MNETKTLNQAIKEAIEDMRDYELVALWNEYCDAVNYYDDGIEYMDSFNELMYGLEPLEIAQRVQGKDFNVNDDYFRFTIYGVESFSDPENYIDIDELAGYISENTVKLK